MIKILSEEDQIKFHHRYRNSDLFRQWSGILCKLEREAKEIDAITLWYYADKADDKALNRTIEALLKSLTYKARG